MKCCKCGKAPADLWEYKELVTSLASMPEDIAQEFHKCTRSTFTCLRCGRIPHSELVHWYCAWFKTFEQTRKEGIRSLREAEELESPPEAS